MYLDDIEAALDDDHEAEAGELAAQLKEELVLMDDNSRQKAVDALGARILTADASKQGPLYELTGIPRPTVPVSDPKDALVDNLLSTAAAKWGRERDELVEMAIKQVANFSDLAVSRWRGEFKRLAGIEPQVFDRQIRRARSLPSDEARAEVIGGQLCWIQEPLLNCAPIITAERIYDDGLSPEVRLTIDARLASGETLPAIEIPATELESGTWVRRWGARVIHYTTPGNRHKFTRAIQEISVPTMRRETVHTFTGWKDIDNSRAFLTTTGAITADGLLPGISVDLASPRMNNYSLPEPSSNLRAALAASLAFLDLAPLHVTAVLWSAMYAAPLTELHPFNGVIWIAGKTQSRKTTLSTLALAHYGAEFIQGHNTYPPATWEYSITALEAAWFAAKDVPLLIDNYRPQFGDRGEAGKQHAKAEAVLSTIGDRGIRGRGQRDGKSRAQRPPRGLILATSEQPLVGQGVVGRTVNVSMWPDDVMAVGPNNPLDVAQHAAHDKGLYAQAMAGYIQWLARDWQKATALARSEHTAALNDGYTQLPSTQGRLADYYSVLAMAAALALEFCEEQGAITSSDHTRLADEINQALMHVLQEQAQRTSDQSPTHKLCEALSDRLASGNAQLLEKLSGKPAPVPGIVTVGWYDPDKPIVYLQTGPALTVARDYWSKLGVNLDILPEALRRDVAGAGLLAERDDRQLEVKKYMGSEYGSQRVMVLDANKLEALTGLCLYPPKMNAEFSRDDDS